MWMVDLTLWELLSMNKAILASVEKMDIHKRIVIGNDLVFLPEFKISCTDAFKAKVYTEREITYCEQFADPLLRYASTWAAKEAIYKALKQLHAAALSWKKIEIIREQVAGIPQPVIHSSTHTETISLSITHDGDYVWAIAIATKL